MSKRLRDKHHPPAVDPVRVFTYLPTFDAFTPTPEYTAIAETLGLIEWSPVVWIGRLFTLDNDYGEHWFDNWDEREALEKRMPDLACDSESLLIIVPRKFSNGSDGPCHSDVVRKAFWTDVLKSLHLSLDTLALVARENNEAWKGSGLEDDYYIRDLDARIARLKGEAS